MQPYKHTRNVSCIFCVCRFSVFFFYTSVFPSFFFRCTLYPISRSFVRSFTILSLYSTITIIIISISAHQHEHTLKISCNDCCCSCVLFLFCFPPDPYKEKMFRSAYSPFQIPYGFGAHKVFLLHTVPQMS